MMIILIFTLMPLLAGPSVVLVVLFYQFISHRGKIQQRSICIRKLD